MPCSQILQIIVIHFNEYGIAIRWVPLPHCFGREVKGDQKTSTERVKVCDDS